QASSIDRLGTTRARLLGVAVGGAAALVLPQIREAAAQAGTNVAYTDAPNVFTQPLTIVPDTFGLALSATGGMSLIEENANEYALLNKKALYLGQPDRVLTEIRFRTNSADSATADKANWLIGPDYQGADFVLLNRIHPDSTGDDFIYATRGTIGSEMPRLGIGGGANLQPSDPI